MDRRTIPPPPAEMTVIDDLARTAHTIERTAPLFPVGAGLIAGIVLDRFCPVGVWLHTFVFVAAGAAALARPVRAWVGMLIPSRRPGAKESNSQDAETSREPNAEAARDQNRKSGPSRLLDFSTFRLFNVFVASACAGAMLHLSSVRTIPTRSIERYTNETARITRLCGEVVSQPRILTGGPNPFGRWSYQSERTAFLVDVESIEGVEAGVAVTGRVRVTVGEAVLDLREGELVELFGMLYQLKPPRNPGSFDWAAFQRRQRIVAGLRCNHRENVRRLDPSPPARPNPRTWLRIKARGLLTDDLATGADEEASLLEAMVLGHRSKLDRRLNDVFIKAGCTHFLAVSGIHVVIVMFFARFSVRAVGLRRRAQIWAMLGAVILYLLLVEPRPPILRAGVIAVIYCVACLLGRERACLNWISATVIVLALFDPAMVFDIGYQLSSAAVLGVSYLAPALRHAGAAARRMCERLIPRRAFAEEDRKLVRPSPGHSGPVARLALRFWRGSRRYVSTALAITFAAWLAALPIVAGSFHRVHLWGPINSFLVLPLMSIVMALGFTKLFLGLLSPALGAMVTGPLTAVDSFLIRSVDHLALLPGASLPIAAPPWWLVASYYLFLILVAWRFSPGVTYGLHVSTRRGQAAREPITPPATPRWLRAVRVGALALLVVSGAVWCCPRGTSDRLIVTFLAVGPGSATVIELPDGRTVLFDAGAHKPYDVGRTTIVPFLRHRGISAIDRVYVSHANFDHFNGLLAIVEEIDTGPLMINPYFGPHSTPGSPSRYLLDRLAARGHPIETLEPSPAMQTLGGVTFELLAPVGPRDDTLSPNDASTVLRLSYAGCTLLLTGDIETRAQEMLLHRPNLRADVLVLPHHGGVRPTLKAFVEAVAPSVVIRSSHERMDETFSALGEIVGATRLYNTADVGAIEVVLDDAGIHVSTSRPGG